MPLRFDILASSLPEDVRSFNKRIVGIDYSGFAGAASKTVDSIVPKPK